MAFTQSSVQTELDNGADGANCTITRFNVGSTTTDIYVQNANKATSRKAGWTQVLSSRTAAQAASDIRSNLTA